MNSSNKKAAIELSIGTIIIIVLGVSMLILGMVLVRSIMCKAIGLTDDVNGKVKDELNNYFGETEREVVCIGMGEATKMSPKTGKESYVYCVVHAQEESTYEFTITDYKTSIASLNTDTLKSWVTQSTYSQRIPPGSDSPRKVFTVKLPSNAPEGNIRLVVSVKKDGILLDTLDLDYEIDRLGAIQSTVC